MPDPAASWVVKAQVPVGGRGKAGGIAVADDASQVPDIARSLSRKAIGGFPIRLVRVERRMDAVAELYAGITMDAAAGEAVIMLSASGGVDVEAASDRLMRAQVPFDADAMRAALDRLSARFPGQARQVLAEAGAHLVDAFFRFDATLIEINPLFLRPNGTWVAGDLRMDVDLNALPRQPKLEALIDARPETYADAAFKRAHGYDLVVIDPGGAVGLVATGAGLSMQLLDDMTRRGLRPYNFCDIRSGMMRGDPTRLIENLRAVQAGSNVQCVLVNIFAGITELGEFAELLLAALDAVPDLDRPMVVRLVGNGEAEAEAILRKAALPDLTLERDLDRALDLCAEVCRD